MKKVAVFVEGQAELILVRELLLKMYDYQDIGINCYNLICDNLDEAPYQYGDKMAHNYYMLVNVVMTTLYYLKSLLEQMDCMKRDLPRL